MSIGTNLEIKLMQSSKYRKFTGVLHIVWSIILFSLAIGCFALVAHHDDFYFFRYVAYTLFAATFFTIQKGVRIMKMPSQEIMQKTVELIKQKHSEGANYQFLLAVAGEKIKHKYWAKKCVGMGVSLSNQ